jgi:hypothetical protein
MKKLISILIIFAIAILPVQAKDIIKTRVHISNEFQLAKVPETVKFKTQKKNYYAGRHDCTAKNTYYCESFEISQRIKMA